MAQEQPIMALGLQLDEKSALVTYYNSTMHDPITWEPEDSRGKEQYALQMDPDVWKAACGLGRAIDLLTDYLRDLFEKILHLRDFSGIRIMVTVPKLEKLIAERIPKALMMLGIERKNIYLQGKPM